MLFIAFFYDFDPLTVAVSSTNDNVSAVLNTSGYLVDLVPSPNFNGSTTITVSVDDGETTPMEKRFVVGRMKEALELFQSKLNDSHGRI